MLKVSHHGSADPGLAALLARLRPRSPRSRSGAHNPYGHPGAGHLRDAAGGGRRGLPDRPRRHVRLEERGDELRGGDACLSAQAPLGGAAGRARI